MASGEQSPQKAAQKKEGVGWFRRGPSLNWSTPLPMAAIFTGEKSKSELATVLTIHDKRQQLPLFFPSNRILSARG